MPLSRSHARSAVLGILFSSLAVILVGCGPSAPEERYELRGRVVSVDKEKKRVTIDHEEIPGYMPAMTMPFRVKDDWVLDAAAPGRIVQADLVVAGKSSWIERVTVSTEAGSPGLPSRVEGATEPIEGAPAPAVALVNHDRERITLDSWRGKAVALTFIYTRCPLPDFCPLMTDNFAAVERRLLESPELASSTQLVSISIDPAFDTPDIMRAYGVRVADGARIPDNWDFATGTPEEVRKVAQAYGLVYEDAEDQILHTLRTAVIAPDGTLFKVFRGNEWTPDELYEALVAARSSRAAT